MSSASGTITVASRNGFIHEFRNLLDSALRARKRGEAYGPVDLTNGAVKVTVAAPAMPAKPVGNHTPPATEQV